MTHTLVNTWAVGDVLGSIQLNQLAADVAGSLDKTAAGDTLSGVIFLDTAGQIIAAGPSGSGGTILVGAQGLQGYEPASIQATVAGAISLTTATDFVALAVPRTRVINQIILPAFIDGSAWAPNVGAVKGKANASVTIELLFQDMHDGATLTSFTMAVTVTTSHSAVPAVMPSFDIRRASATTPGSANVSLFSGGPVHASAASGAAWFNSGNPQSWTGTVDQNNVIDKANYFYYIVLQDESGSGSQVDNSYTGYAATYSSITSMKFH